MPFSHVLDRIDVAADDRHAVANAGLILPATLATRLGLEAAANEVIDLGARPGYFSPGAKVMTLVHSLIAGADCIDDANRLRAGASDVVLGHRVLAGPIDAGDLPPLLQLWPCRQLDRLCEIGLTRAWAQGAGPGGGPMTIDLDSTICEVHGDRKQGAAYGYTRVLGYHPLLATRAETGEVLHTRMCKGSANTARGASRFITEVAGRVRRAGATGELTMRTDSGFWSQLELLTPLNSLSSQRLLQHGRDARALGGNCQRSGGTRRLPQGRIALEMNWAFRRYLVSNNCSRTRQGA